MQTEEFSSGTNEQLQPLEITSPPRWNEYDDYVGAGGKLEYVEWYRTVNRYEDYVRGGGIASFEDWMRFIIRDEVVIVEEIKAIVSEKNIKFAPHRRCGVCHGVIGWNFAIAREVFLNPAAEDLAPHDLIVGFNLACDCSAIETPIQLRSWQMLADVFNLQTPEDRAAFWTRFKCGEIMIDS